ncbi:GTP 3',8-cyclase MoaA [Pollutimonas bauzanensis]|uniref:GTP 3',8-cyclase n=1 Tax=Pollutimonas bauzanensis TaxID=658167 RepID=A0A1M6AVN0_9BURK|nr:GTP 3',8-cyclase MoaA [Pollutimonas bauzanensis]SHI40500.1 cyclic pyranopterin monophosphate synthase subunit MoaA [Pollutimonas bauzanensis]
MSKVIFHADSRYAAIAAAPSAAPGAGAALLDARRRPLRDLRISVTDRCNFRCTYCMPREVFNAHHEFMPHGALLSFEEITRVARVAAQLGVQKIRLTGGEPLLRKSLEALVEMLARLSTPQGRPLEVTLTTNGTLLAKKAQALKDAGLSRVTVSLDALDDHMFERMSDSQVSVKRVLEGIDVAARVGLPVKVNMVVRKGLNDGQILPMARHFRHSGHILRFIEFMDVGSTNGWNLREVLTGAEILQRIAAEFPLEPVQAGYRGEVANRWRYADDGGEIGLITSMSQPFCGDCTRARLSPEGKLFLCLFASQGHDLRALLRGGAGDGEIAARLAGIWSARDDRYSELRGRATQAEEKIEMSYIGG